MRALRLVAGTILILLGGLMAIVTATGLERGWALAGPQFLLCLFIVTALIAAGGAVLWHTVTRASLSNFILAFGAASIAYLICFRFGSGWERYQHFYDSPPPASVLFGYSLLMAFVTWLGLMAGQFAVAKLQWPRVFGLPMLICSAISAIGVSLCFASARGDDVIYFLLASAILLLPMLCLMAMSLMIGRAERA